jgi:hypothetical protein
MKIGAHKPASVIDKLEGNPSARFASLRMTALPFKRG